MPRLSNPQITLRPQDLVILLRLSIPGSGAAPYSGLAAELHMSPSEVHGGVERAVAAGLAFKDSGGHPAIVREALKRFLQYGAPYAFPPVHGTLTRGLPTGYAAPPLNERISQPNEPPPVWPYGKGTVRGIALYPLYPTVAMAAQQNPELYELLALFDALRAGSAREKSIAALELDDRLS
jgi:hypothetical protein